MGSVWTVILRNWVKGKPRLSLGLENLEKTVKKEKSAKRQTWGEITEKLFNK